MGGSRYFCWMTNEVSQYITSRPSSQQSILQALRSLILSINGDVKELYKWSRPVYCINKDFCYLQANKNYVTLGFFEFEKVKTNKHLIEGTGKSMRHVKLKSEAEIKEFQLKKMLIEVLD